MSFWDLVANLRIETPQGQIAVLDGRWLYFAERVEHEPRYMLQVLRAIVDQLESASAGAS